MKFPATLLLLVSGILLVGCTCGSQKAEKGDSAAADSTRAVEPPKIAEPAALKPNVLTIDATVESVIILDHIGYRVRLRINSAMSGPGMESMAPGHRFEAVPQFVLDARNAVDVTQERNKKLLALRRSKAGDPLHGKIVLSNDSRWYLIDIDTE